MTAITLKNFAEGRWVAGTGDLAPLCSAVTGEVVAQTSSRGLDFAGMSRFASKVGGPALYVHSRFTSLPRCCARWPRALTARKQELYELSYETGATKGDAWIDIDGGIGTLAVYQSKGRRELPNSAF